MIFSKKYSVLERIGKGKFGEVYRGISIKTSEHVAIKMEQTDTIKLLKHETTILHYLYRKGCDRIPLVYWYGVVETCPTLVMTYFNTCLTRDFSLEDVSVVVSILERIHDCGIIHRDIKTSNIMIKNGQIHIIDFGFATFYTETPCIKEYIIGTPNYISIHIHNGNEPSRRDDLISLGYIYLYFQENSPLFMEYFHLFGENEYSNNPLHIKNPFMLEKRERKKWENISKGVSPSSAIYSYLDYCYQLNYNEKPNYTRLKELLSRGTTS